MTLCTAQKQIKPCGRCVFCVDPFPFSMSAGLKFQTRLFAGVRAFSLPGVRAASRAQSFNTSGSSGHGSFLRQLVLMAGAFSRHFHRESAQLLFDGALE